MSDQSPPSRPIRTEKQVRAEKVAAALRENLHRRKQQARARAATTESTAEPEVDADPQD